MSPCWVNRGLALQPLWNLGDSTSELLSNVLLHLPLGLAPQASILWSVSKQQASFLPLRGFPKPTSATMEPGLTQPGGRAIARPPEPGRAGQVPTAVLPLA